MNATLTKTRSYSTQVTIGIMTKMSDAGWSTTDGYVVHRTTDQGLPAYWVGDKSGRFSCRDSLADARESIDWLRERGR